MGRCIETMRRSNATRAEQLCRAGRSLASFGSIGEDGCVTAARTRTGLTAAAFLLAFADTALAATPISIEQTLCQNTALVFGTVIGAHSHDCRSHADGYCWARGIVGVTVSVDETVFPSRVEMAGHDIQIAIRAHNDLPGNADPEVVRWDNSAPGMLGLPRTGKAVTDRNAGKLVGTEFAFALQRQDYRRKGIPEPYFAAAYSMKDEAWLRAEWPKESCRKWRQGAP
jgi:hypothetical protein